MDFTSSRNFITGAGSWLGSYVYRAIPCERWLRPYDKFPDGKFDYVIHFAQSDIEPILDFTAKNNATLLFISSGSVNNPDPDAKSNKLLQEEAVQKSGVEYRIARLYSFIGPGSPLRYAAAAFIDQALHGRPINVGNNGKSVRTYLYTEDMAKWLLTILAKGERKIYDVGGRTQVTMLELAGLVNRITGNKGIFIRDWEDTDIRPIYTPDRWRLMESLALGLDEWTNIEQAIERTVNAA